MRPAILLRTVTTMLALGAGLSFAAASCGSSDSGGGAGGGSSGPTYTLDDVCAQIVPKICTMRQPCCTSSGIGYDDAACQANEMSKCQANVAEVNAGTMTFDPTNIDACLSGIQPWVDKCTLSFTDYESVFGALKLCRSVFAGSVAEGGACDRDDQCKMPSDPNASTSCSNGTCTTTTLLAEGAACSYASGTTSICGGGTYCDADFTKQPPTGTCKKPTALGASCDKTKMFDLECGVGNYCDSTSGTCTAGKGAGTSCTQQTALQCSTWQCDNGQCAKANPIVNDTDCKGTGATDGGTGG
jgi:hypothetical protein